MARDWFELVVRPYVRKMSPDAFINCVSCLAHVLSVADVAGDKVYDTFRFAIVMSQNFIGLFRY